MKNKLRIQLRKRLSLLLAVCMVLSVGAMLDWSSFLVPEASAASGGNYQVRVYMQNHNTDSDSDFMWTKVYGYDQQGNYGTIADSAYFDEPTGRDYYSGTYYTPYFPTSFNAYWESHNCDKSDYGNNTYVQVYYNGGWQTVMSAGMSSNSNKTGNATYSCSCSGSTGTRPSINSVSITGGANQSLTGNWHATLTSSAISARAYDQFGVQWYQYPTWSKSADTISTTSNSASVTLSSSTYSDHSSTVTASLGGKSASTSVSFKWKHRLTVAGTAPGGTSNGTYDEYNGTTKALNAGAISWYTFTGWTKGGTGSLNSTTSTTPTWTFGNGDGTATATWKANLGTTLYYLNTSGTATNYTDSGDIIYPTTSRTTTPNADFKKNITFNGASYTYLGWRYDKNKDAAAGTGNITVKPGEFTTSGSKSGNTTRQYVYAVYSKAQKCQFHYYTSGGNTINQPTQNTTIYLNAGATDNPTTRAVTVPENPGNAVSNGFTYTFLGWSTSPTSHEIVIPPEQCGQSYTLNIRNEDYHFYAVYSKSISADWHYFTDTNQTLNSDTNHSDDVVYEIANNQNLTASLANKQFSAPANVPETQVINGNTYTFVGWARANDKASSDNAPVVSADDMAGSDKIGMVYPATNANQHFYAVYKRDITANWNYYIGTSKATGANYNKTLTSYLVATNENAEAKSNKVKFAFPQAADVTDNGNDKATFNFIGWRVDTEMTDPTITKAEAQQPYGLSLELQTHNLWAVYSRDVIASYNVNSSDDGVRIATPASVANSTTKQYLSATTDALSNLDNRTTVTLQINPTSVPLKRVGMDEFLGWNFLRENGDLNGALTDTESQTAQFGTTDTYDTKVNTGFIAIFKDSYHTVKVLDYNGIPIVESDKVWDPETNTMAVSASAWKNVPGMDKVIERSIRYNYNYGVNDKKNETPVVIPALDPTVIHHVDGSNHYYYKDWVTSDASSAKFVGSASTGYTVSNVTADTQITATYEGKSHHWVEDKRVAEPTCTLKGYYHRYCTVCGYGKTDAPEYDAANNKVKSGTYSYNTIVAIAPNGHSAVEIDNKPATCTLPGMKDKFVCPVCFEPVDKDGNPLAEGAEWGEVIPAKGHDFKVTADTVEYTEYTCSVCSMSYKVYKTGEKELYEVPAKDATCTEDGNLLYYKTADNKYYEDSAGLHEITAERLAADYIIPALNHDFSVETEGSEPTCTMFGTEAGMICSRCGEPENPDNRIPALGHNLKVIEAVEATCTTPGNTEGLVCARCDYVETESVVIPATGHKLGGMVYVAPTCLEAGSNYRYCQNAGCGYKEGSVIPALGHDMVEVPEVAATCTKTGTAKYYVCSREDCGYMSGDAAGNVSIDMPATIEALGHDIQVKVVEATCTEGGYTETYCTRCDAMTVRSDETEAKGHSGGSATCLAKAVCEVCGASYGTLGDHTMILVEDNAGDCQHRAYKLYKCDVCGKTQKTTGKLGDHKWVETVTAATCTAEGFIGRKCSVCGSETSVTTPALGHNVENWTVENAVATGTCTRCGETITGNPAEVVPGYEVQRCPKCNLVHEGRTGIFVQDGLYCKVVGFFRSIINMIKNIGK